MNSILIKRLNEALEGEAGIELIGIGLLGQTYRLGVWMPYVLIGFIKT